MLRIIPLLKTYAPFAITRNVNNIHAYRILPYRTPLFAVRRLGRLNLRPSPPPGPDDIQGEIHGDIG